MASVVVWETSHEQWMADNKEGETHFFDDKAAAIQSACSMERNKDKPKNVFVFKKDGSGMADNIPVSKDD